jgi:lipoate-protein ligase A
MLRARRGSIAASPRASCRGGVAVSALDRVLDRERSALRVATPSEAGARRRVVLLEESFPGRPALDAAVSRALLERAARGPGPETLRLYRPDDVLAFSASDAGRKGFPAAVEAARAARFDPMLRLAGGRAALFHRGTLAFAWSIPAADSRRGVAARFEELSGLVAEVLRALGVDARVGEVPGEYCPGAHSVNARGRSKLMGVGQRLVRGAAHVGGVIVVRDARRLREGLASVYAPLGYGFEPEAAGSVEEEIEGATLERIATALRRALDRRHDLEPGRIDDEILARAGALEPLHRVPAE